VSRRRVHGISHVCIGIVVPRDRFVRGTWLDDPRGIRRSMPSGGADNCRVPLSKIFQNFFYFSSMKATHDFNPKDKVNRPGIHAKTKTSKNKKSKLYKKAYRGQGR
jgi:hypothetical protein